MSYLVLARKSRPQTFDQVVGQRPVVKTLRNSILRDRVAHAILFSGVRGVGKTTLARIMAKAINCSAEMASRPCDKCPSCKEISSGSSLDLYEIDGASNRGIQEIRELKEKIRFLPSTAKYKVIIIDEVHMLTTEAFNALLKTLEEPPAHVYFMFATTEIHKIPITILSRCQQYELKRISAKELYDHFDKLATSEGFQIDPSALALIVREAAGSVRDGLSLLDQMFSFGDTTIKASDVAEVLGLVDREVLGTLTKGLLEGDKTAVFTSLETVFNFGMDIKRFTADLLAQFRNLLLCKIDGCTELLDLPEEELRQYQSMAADYTSETIHLKLSLLMQMTEQVKQSSQARIAIETSFLKIIEATNVVPLSSLLGHLQEIMPNLPVTATLQKQAVAPQRTEGKKKTDVAVKAGPSQNDRPTLPQVKNDPEGNYNSSNAATVNQASAEPPVPAYIHDQAPLPPEPEELTRKAPPVNVSPATKPGKSWTDFIDYIKADTVWMATNLQRADSVSDETDGVITLIFSDGMNCSLLCQKENQQHLDEFALAFFKRPVKIKIVVPEIDNSLDKNGGESPQKKRQQLINDPLVTMAAEIFNGQVGDVRIISK
jgi:DNA polymerase-3 subunit gamma/tau